MRYNFIKKYTLLFLLIFLISYVKCNGVLDSNKITKNIGHGPGGPAILTGIVPQGVTILVFQSSDYTKELANLTVTSGSDSFKITDLPIDTVDVITIGSRYFASKISLLLLKKGENVIKSTFIDTCFRSSLGLPRYAPDKVDIIFKPGIDSLVANSILTAYGCSIVNVVTLEHTFYFVKIPQDRTIPEIIKILVLDEQTYFVEPCYLRYPIF